MRSAQSLSSDPERYSSSAGGSIVKTVKCRSWISINASETVMQIRLRWHIFFQLGFKRLQDFS